MRVECRSNIVFAYDRQGEVRRVPAARPSTRKQGRTAPSVMGNHAATPHESDALTNEPQRTAAFRFTAKGIYEVVVLKKKQKEEK